MEHAHHHHHAAAPEHGAPSLPQLTTSATLHCLTGCAIGELFLAAWPVNYWLLRGSVKKPCH